MISESVWRSILTASSSSEAVELAGRFPVSTLHQSRMPWAYEDLSSRSQANIRAISRAFDVAIDGIPSDGWTAWLAMTDDARLTYGWEDITLDVQLGESEHKTDQHTANGITLQNVATSTAALVATPDHHGESQSSEMEIGGYVKDVRPSNPKLLHGPEKEPRATEIKSAEAVRNWAQQAPHTPPPSEAVDRIRKSSVASKLLAIIVSPGDPPTLRATIIGTFSEDIGSTFAGQIMKTLIIPYVTTLKAPASREMMQAIVKFSELHWRTAVSLYELTNNEGQISGAMAEVLVRVAVALNRDAAVQSLRVFSNLKWGEDGIRVLETLVGKCKEAKNIAGVIVSAIEGNILGLESSVRFGKLLFTVARDIPSISESYEQEMEAVIGRSKVFLAKRALKILKERKSKQNPAN